MKNKEDMYSFLKKINVPAINNKSHMEDLERRLKVELQRNEFEKNIKREKSLFLKFSLSFAVLLILFSLFSIVTLFIPKNLGFYLAEVYGSAYLTTEKNGIYKKIDNKSKLKEKYSIKTDENGFVAFRAGTGYNINIGGSAEIKLLKSRRNMSDEKMRLYLKKGTGEFSIERPTKRSVFEVETDFLNFSVRGTDFSIKAEEGKEVRLRVNKGSVKVSGFIKNISGLKSIKEKNIVVYNKLVELINSELIIGENNGLIITKEQSAELEEVLELIYLKAGGLEKLKNEDAFFILDNIKILKIKMDELYLNKNEISEKKEEENIFFTVELINNLKIKLEEKNTAITSYGKNIFIASDSNNSVYCFDNAGNLKFQFKDKDLKTVTSPAIVYKNEIIISSPDFIYILNNDGSIKIKEGIKNGTEYWSYSVVLNDFLFIPSGKKILKYDGVKISVLEDITEAFGQVFLAGNSNNIFFNDLNNKKVLSYDFKNFKKTMESDELDQRAIISPLIINDNLFLADIGHTVYKFDINKSKPEKLKINTGVMSNLVYKNNFLYFVALDGYLYKVNAENFKNYQKVVKVDNEKNKDKFLTKRISITGNDLYYCSENGSLFYLNLKSEKFSFLKVSDFELIASPALVNASIYLFDNNGNVYKILKND